MDAQVKATFTPREFDVVREALNERRDQLIAVARDATISPETKQQARTGGAELAAILSKLQ